MRDHDEHFGGMSDSDYAAEHEAQKAVEAVIEALRADPGYPRIAAATLLRRAADGSELRHKQINDFSMAILDEDAEVDSIIHDEAPSFPQWSQDIAAARRGEG